MPNISLIAAVADNYAIGINGKMPWHMPADLKHFKSLTSGHAVVMGRKTFESLPGGALPNRKNIVLSRSFTDESTQGYLKANSLEAVIDLLATEEEFFIIGGSTIYQQTMDAANKLYITWIHADFEADTFFPEIKPELWKESDRKDFPADEKNPYPYSFVTYERKA